MAYTLEGKELFSIDLAPETEREEVLRNVAVILSTTLHECPGYRDFGTDREYLDRNVLAAQQVIVRDVVKAVEEQEPRAVVESVELFRDSETGVYYPRVTLEINV